MAVPKVDLGSVAAMVVAVVFVVRLVVMSALACGRGVVDLLRAVPAGTRVGLYLGRLQVEIVIGAPRIVIALDPHSPGEEQR
jgi:hypothetical protein